MKFQLATIDGKRTLFAYQQDVPKGTKTTEIDVPTDKEGLMGAIQELLTEADEAKQIKGEDIVEITNMAPSIKEAVKQDAQDYAQRVVALDEAFSQLPLARQLDLAAVAMENAREKL